jgi:hypothetical protein
MRLTATMVTCLIVCLVLVFSSLNAVHATVTGTFHFRAWFDGSDYVYIQNAGGLVWYEHIKYDYPGEHPQEGVPYNATYPAPTTIDGVDWIPVWNKTIGMSDTYVSGSSQNYPSGEWIAFNITKIVNESDTTQSRGPVTIEDYPSSSNNYTAKVLVNDDTGSIIYLGAAWYEFELSWEAPQLVPEYPIGIIAGLFALLPLTLVIFLSKRRSSR